MKTAHDTGRTVHPRVPSGVALEPILFWTAAAAQAIARVLYVFNHRADADEPQHLHVVWSWTQGLVQYRDQFDNHAPLFHLAMAPIVWIAGERSDLLIIMRGMMLPLVAIALWSTYHLGKRLWSARVGRWGALLAGCAPTFLLTTTEFRTDVLWMTGWLATLSVLMRGSFTPRRAALAGLLLGATVATSLKTLPLMLALAMASTIAEVLFRGARQPPGVSGRMRAFGCLVVGTLFIPVVLVGGFWRLGALESLAYCTIWHNIVPHVGLWGAGIRRMLIFPFALAGLGGAASVLVRSRAIRVTERQIIMFITAGLYLALLESYWPLITKQDFLPSTPLVALLLVAGVAWTFDSLARVWNPVAVARARVLVFAAMCVVDLVAVCRLQLPWRYSNQIQQQTVATTLWATRPGEPVLDIQGETIFRPRPFYYILENLTVARLANGMLKDDIAADIVRTRTHFAVEDCSYLPPDGRRFLNEHFLSFGVLRVLGTRLADEGDGNRGEHTFDVCYPERFAILANGVRARGTLDGVRYHGPMLLQTGMHCYRPEPGERNVLAVWDVALDRGLLADAPPTF